MLVRTWTRRKAASMCKADGIATLSRLPVEALVTLGPNVAAEEISVAGGVEVRTFVPHDQTGPEPLGSAWRKPTAMGSRNSERCLSGRL
jgi:hypothetical protein